MTEQVKFAGQTFTTQRNKTQADLRKEQQDLKRKTGNEALDSLVKQIVDKDKNVNCMQKTRMDWDKYTADARIQEDLEKNRKDGYLQKKAFVEKVQETEYNQKKAIEKLARRQ